MQEIFFGHQRQTQPSQVLWPSRGTQNIKFDNSMIDQTQGIKFDKSKIDLTQGQK